MQRGCRQHLTGTQWATQRDTAFLKREQLEMKEGCCERKPCLNLLRNENGLWVSNGKRVSASTAGSPWQGAVRPYVRVCGGAGTRFYPQGSGSSLQDRSEGPAQHGHPHFTDEQAEAQSVSYEVPQSGREGGGGISCLCFQSPSSYHMQECVCACACLRACTCV